MKIKLESTYKGTHILMGEEALKKRRVVNTIIELLWDKGYSEIMIPIIQKAETFSGKVGGENLSMMYTFQDMRGRDLCLAPEYTAVVQQLAREKFKFQKDIKLFYIQECFRGERPQAGRYRQFTQVGVEILNPSISYNQELQELACEIVGNFTAHYQLDTSAKRGLDYYKEGMGFEIKVNSLGAQKQVCGGGEYEGGVGFAVGLDRLLLL